VLKADKEVLIKELTDKFSRAKTVIVSEMRKVDVATVTRLRKKLREGGIEFKVLKNTLARRAAKGSSVEVISEDFVGPVSVAVSYGDVVLPAKILTEFIKDLETIKLKSAVVEGKRIDANGIKALAKLPGLPQLRAQILGMINQPASKLARTIKEPSNALARVLNARASQST
jgi:large subunit ribosomal protein L10